jgi:hypothetical protein
MRGMLKAKMEDGRWKMVEKFHSQPSNFHFCFVERIHFYRRSNFLAAAATARAVGRCAVHKLG